MTFLNYLRLVYKVPFSKISPLLIFISRVNTGSPSYIIINSESQIIKYAYYLSKLILWWCMPPAFPRPPGCLRCLPAKYTGVRKHRTKRNIICRNTFIQAYSQFNALTHQNKLIFIGNTTKRKDKKQTF